MIEELIVIDFIRIIFVLYVQAQLSNVIYVDRKAGNVLSDCVYG